MPDVISLDADEKKQDADNFHSSIEAQIAQLQAQYFVDNGRFFQGLPLPAGEVTTKDLEVKPTDQEEDWSDFGYGPHDPSEVELAIHVYDGPKGQGYTISLKVVDDTLKEHVRFIHTGPETLRDTDWALFEVPNA